MIRAHPDGDLAKAIWIDVVSPSADEVASVERATGLRVPAESHVAEIESSSRLAFASGTFTLTAPFVARAADGTIASVPVGFVLDRARLITVRFASYPLFDEAFDACRAKDTQTSGDVMLELLEVVIDRMADGLEHAATEADSVARGAFADRRSDSVALRAALRRIGLVAEKMSHLRDSLLGIGRIAAYVSQSDLEGAPTLHPARLKAIQVDVNSLTEYEAHLQNKTQFLLDATLGFISIEQNEIVKTLTIASVVGVPPVLVAGIYGMNFHVMPELAWPLGYPFALVLIVVSGLIPLAFFKRRGWM